MDTGFFAQILDEAPFGWLCLLGFNFISHQAAKLQKAPLLSTSFFTKNRRHIFGETLYLKSPVNANNAETQVRYFFGVAN